MQDCEQAKNLALKKHEIYEDALNDYISKLPKD
jgi:hypothetical protein